MDRGTNEEMAEFADRMVEQMVGASRKLSRKIHGRTLRSGRNYCDIAILADSWTVYFTAVDSYYFSLVAGCVICEA